MRYFLIDRVTEVVPGSRVTGIKNVSATEDVLLDHFPEFPVMPGALLIEAAAQLGGFLVELGQEPAADGRIRRAVLVQVDRTKLRELVAPGDSLLVRVELLSALAGASRVAGEVAAAGRQVAEMELTFSLRTVPHEAIHAQRRQLYHLWTRGLDLAVPIL